MNNFKSILLILIVALYSGSLWANDNADSTLLIQKGDQAYSEARYKQALKYYQHASSGAADKPALYIKIARCFQYAGVYKSALIVVDGILSTDSENINALLIKAEITEAQNDNEAALAIYQQLEAIDSDNNAVYQAIYHAVYQGQASVLRKMGRETDAKQALDKIKAWKIKS